MVLIAVWPFASLIFTLPLKDEPTNAPIIDQERPCAQGGLTPLAVRLPLGARYLSVIVPNAFDLPLSTKPFAFQWLTPVPRGNGRVDSGGTESQPKTVPPKLTLKTSFVFPASDRATICAGPALPSVSFVQLPVQVPASVLGVKVAAAFAPEAAIATTASTIPVRMA
jgi:hypothetical protein